MPAFGILMRDNSPVDYPFRRSGKAAEETVKLGYVPAGPYYRRDRAPGTWLNPVAPRLGFVPAGPYYRRDRAPGTWLNPVNGYGIPPGQAARVPQYNGFGESESSLSAYGDDASAWANLGTSLVNLTTGIIDAATGGSNPNTTDTTSCPAGYYYSGGRCMQIPQQQTSSISPMMIGVGVIGLGALLFLAKK